MVIQEFPDPRQSTPEGIVALGGDLDTESLILAYRQGIFPWPIQGMPLTWFCPPERAILDWVDLHVPRSLAKKVRKNPFQFTLNHCFDRVIQECAARPRPLQDGTWITPKMIRAYCRLHQLGYAHSIEAWSEGQLVGGLYGVDSGGVFAGESMFFLKPDASKLCILFLMKYLSDRGSTWIDIQVMTPHMKVLGARLISRDDFLNRLGKEQSRRLSIF
jgi:leucyl/phenylalanyl-tRNA--protein transferase